MPTPEAAKRSATYTFNAASDAYDDPVLGFRDNFGRETVERLSISQGARVLDVCCGTGSSAIPAAESVGPSGFVIGVDLADRLLALAREKARQRALQNITFRVADMLELDYQARKLRCGPVRLCDLSRSGHGSRSAGTMALRPTRRQTCHYELGTKRS